ncbi:protein translocase subunit SecDF [Roseivirga sp. BDSF3-8]|uniref:protein translocase subunit SecDF n=1 Tax=Roseivirga sp. BDSF3-8 TaxID=3241598 RepID=UPI003531AB1A
MRNKGIIVTLTVIITALCLFYLHFTFVARSFIDEATEYATTESGSIDYQKRQAYLDSLRRTEVYNFLGAGYTFEDIENNQLNLGLDLKGGMHVTLEVSPIEIVRGLANNSQNPAFNAAIERAREMSRTSEEPFTELFYEAYKEEKPDGRLAEVFANAANRDRFSFQSTDQEILSVINEEIEGAIDRSFQILRTRIDRAGTTQPNIQRLPNSDRIQVELPGVEDKERIRKLLQGVAKLEFFEVQNMNEVSAVLSSINQKLLQEEKLARATGETQETDAPEVNEEDIQEMLQDQPQAELTEAGAEEEALTEGDTSELSEEDLESQLAQADSVAADSALNQNTSALFRNLVYSDQMSLYYEVKDTSKINRILKRDEIKSLIPRNIKFLWAVKPIEMGAEGDEDQMEALRLYAIKTERGGKAPLTGDAVSNASIDFSTGNPGISMRMNPAGTRDWARLTASNIGRAVAIVLDNYVYSAPVVQSEITGGSSQITGDFTIEEAEDLANVLKAGSLPAPTRIVEEAVVGPTLGKQAQAQGVISILAGLGIVILFMIAYYSKGGIIANVALLFNVLFILGILAQPSLGTSLTLPGIAGIVLTIGMSIDANVLIFERIREELRNGVNKMRAIQLGYEKAFSSIIDANVTTLIIAIILFVLGQGPVKGFAVTLMIGIFCSFFSAVFITRVIVTWMTKKGDDSKISFATPFSKSLLAGLNIEFIGIRKKAYMFSGAFILIGMIVLGVFGLNLGVDFTGGRSYVVSFTQPVVPSELKVDLTDDFENKSVEVKTFGSSNVLKVTTSYLIDDEREEADGLVEDRLVAGITEATGMTFVPNGNALDDAANSFTISSSSKVGATIASDIKRSSWESGLLALVAIFFYIYVRFHKWQFGLGAIVALFHDVLFTLSAFAIAGLLGFSYEVDQIFIAAILTIIGYSINDTVVVFDRIREYLGERVGNNTKSTFNIAINSTLNRTVITSVTTLIVVLILLIFGGEVLRGFSFALFVGILVGTYSSIFIAAPTVVDLYERSEARKKVQA